MNNGRTGSREGGKQGEQEREIKEGGNEQRTEIEGLKRKDGHGKGRGRERGNREGEGKRKEGRK